MIWENHFLRLLCCPACGDERLVTLWEYAGYPVQRCASCGWVMLNPQPAPDTLDEIYDASYFLGADDPESRNRVSELKRATAAMYLDQIEAHSGRSPGKLLEVGCGNGELLVEAASRGYEVCGLDASKSAVERANETLGAKLAVWGTLEQTGILDAQFDVVAAVDVIEYVRDPLQFLEEAHRVLKPGGILLVVTPDVNCKMARWLKRHWFEFKIEHLHYLSRSTLQNVLSKSGFGEVQTVSNRKALSLAYVQLHFSRFPVPGMDLALDVLSRLVPRRLQNHPFSVPTGGLTVLARAEVRRPRRLVSVIVPVFNERETVTQVLDQLVEKRVAGVDLEIVVVESNSTDGTREAVLQYQGRPGVKILLTEGPKGKGHAVRDGLGRATGDIVMIQDADLEYDIDDYEALLAPIVAYRSAFVLGSRHKGKWKMRHFEEHSFLAAFLNGGHVFLTAFFNLLYGQRLSDPWTMYKVFRRDCLYAIRLECDRFDLDVELVAKLVRRGFVPIEIPVAYRSRSFADGKKIRVLTDPWTWLWACIKYRLVSPGQPRFVGSGSVDEERMVLDRAGEQTESTLSNAR